MASTNIKNVMSFMILAALIAGIGCGDGKRQKRNAIDRSKTSAQKVDPNAKNAPAATGGDNKNTPAANGGDTSAETTEKNKKVDANIQAIWAKEIEGTSINISALESGSYKLEGMASHLSVCCKADNSIEAVAVSVPNADQKGQLNVTDHDQRGLLANGDAGLGILVPYEFTLGKEIGQIREDAVALSQVDPQSSAMKNTLVAKTVSSRLSLAKILTGETPDQAIKTEVTAIKGADNTVRFHIVTQEEEGQTRRTVLVYSFKAEAKAEEAKQEAQPAAEQASAETVPETTSVTIAK